MITFYHKNCNDGFLAATIAAMHHKEGDKYAAATYGEHLPSPGGVHKKLLFVDFCPSAEVVKNLLELGHQITIIDHHKTAEAAMKELDGLNNLELIFDMNKCGALLTWNYYNPYEKPPPLVEYVNDRDLWLKQLPETDAVAVVLTAYPKSMRMWEKLLYDPPIANGELLLEYKTVLVKQLMDRVHRIDLDGYSVYACNTSLFQSDVCAEILKTRGDTTMFAVCYHDNPGGRAYSLRSTDRFDVSELAKKFGGGGHARAAGMFIKKENQNEKD